MSEGTKGGELPSGRWKLFFQQRKKLLITLTIMLLILLGVAIGVGVGVGARQHNSGDDSSLDSSSSSGVQSSNNSAISNGSYWKPTTGETWQIVLNHTPMKIDMPATVFDIDMFDNSADTIADLADAGHKVICYFSAGSYEDWREDASKFQKSDYANKLVGWKGEYWLDVRKDSVRNITKSRLDLAASKKCNGVDPDNIDGYDNKTGLDLTEDDAVDYLRFLAQEAHAHGLSIGLKNGGSIVDRVVGFLDWEVNESCEQYDECGLFKPFIDQNKPVFHIEYKEDGKSLSQVCSAKNINGFSTVYKNLDLDDTVQYCP